MTTPTFALPGQPLAPSSSHLPGPGTHLHTSHIIASLAGLVSENPSSTSTSKTANASKATLTVTSPTPSTLLPTRTLLPTVDSTVLARVTRITARQASVEVLVVGDRVCVEGWQGLIRVQDVRATEKDRVKILESFRPGDIVRAVVISLGDQSNYYLSTASNLLGVIMATSEDGNAMFPVSWKEFRDPVTGKMESRKVAKPF